MKDRWAVEEWKWSGLLLTFQEALQPSRADVVCVHDLFVRCALGPHLQDLLTLQGAVPFPWCTGSATLRLVAHVVCVSAEDEMVRIAALLPVACMKDKYVRWQCDAVVIFIGHTMNAPHA